MFEHIVIPRGRVVDTIHEALWRAIIRHELPPGHHLSVPALAEEFSVSRSPVREAILRLVHEGLATEEARRGVSVISFQKWELISIYEVRGALEALAASQAAARADEQHIARLKEMLERQSQAIEADNLEAHNHADMDFHAEIMATAGSPVLQEMLRQIYGRIRVAMLARVFATGPSRAFLDHQMIFDAIASGDGDAAAAAAHQHVQRVCEGLKCSVDDVN